MDTFQIIIAITIPVTGLIVTIVTIRKFWHEGTLTKLKSGQEKIAYDELLRKKNAKTAEETDTDKEIEILNANVRRMQRTLNKVLIFCIFCSIFYLIVNLPLTMLFISFQCMNIVSIAGIILLKVILFYYHTNKVARLYIIEYVKTLREAILANVDVSSSQVNIIKEIIDLQKETIAEISKEASAE